MAWIDSRLIPGAVLASSRALALANETDPDMASHRFMIAAARTNAAFMLAIGSPDIADLLQQLADAWEAVRNTGQETP
jgi:hypothetical protein